MKPQTLQYAARVENVDELSLHGTADGDFWRERLKPFGLAPMLTDGAAQLTLIAAQMKFAGVLFRELSVSIDLERPQAEGDDGVYLLQAFNTVRFFAWMERVWFHTPYQFAELEFTAGQSFRLLSGDHTVLRAEVSPRTLPPAEDLSRGGPVLLPPKTSAVNGPLKWFHAKLAGKTRRSPFQSTDTLQLEAAAAPGVIADLVASHFKPREWTILDAGFHGKSKTYPGPAPGFAGRS